MPNHSAADAQSLLDRASARGRTDPTAMRELAEAQVHALLAVNEKLEYLIYALTTKET